jgi:hypothetical protein
VALGFALGVLLVVALFFAGLFIVGSIYALALGVKKLVGRLRSALRGSTRIKKR